MTSVVSSANDLLSAHKALVSRVRASQKHHQRRLRTLLSPPQQLLDQEGLPSPPHSPPPSPPPSVSAPNPRPIRADLSAAKRARAIKYHNYVPEEETIRNDYSQRYVDGGEWPQNWVLGAEPEHRFEEYPKQQRLLSLKKVSVATHALPSSFLPFASLSSLQPCKFDVILLDPPFSSTFTWDYLQDLPVPSLAADPSFVFMWVGSGAGEGLERGREILAKWGYRRCEDVVWVKTNKATNRGPGTDSPTTSLLTRTKQHCLIGIRGTVRRSTDSWFVHCNVDTDVIIWEGDPTDPTRKPPEMYTLIENFCLGTRRLEIFGKCPSSLRKGWVTALADGQENHLDDVRSHVEGGAVQWEKDTWESGIKALANGGKFVVPVTSDIDALRPKSPFRPGIVGNGGGGTMGAGRVGQPADGIQGRFRGNVPQQGSLGPMMVPPAPALGMNILGGMGNPDLGVDGMMPGILTWPGMMGSGNLGAHAMGGMMVGQQGQIHMDPMGIPGFNGAIPGMGMGMGMGWPGIGGEMQVQHQYMDNQGVWDGMDEMMGMGMAMGGYGGMNIGVDQWNTGFH